MSVVEIVKRKLTDPTDDSLIEMDIEEVGQAIMIYCNREDIPKELKYVHANMVIDLINSENRSKDPDGNTSVSSVKEGDVQVTFGSARVESRERATERLLFDYAKQLNRFRKLRW